MDKFLILISFIILPIYFVWFIVCIIQGQWLTVNIFKWEEHVRVMVAIWVIFATLFAVISP